ncbi:MAG: hypothetical protein K2P81_10330 [Bacteriovoracaceae bacterium]|nr:hypothetical protein [Bacteriovoracaceae bacterium]
MKIRSDIEVVVKKAKVVFDELDKIIPGIKKKAYLVYSSRFGQCAIGSDIFFILTEFPQAFVTKERVSIVTSLLKDRKKALKELSDIKVIDKKIDLALADILISEDVNVELRFHPGMLDYSLINKVLSSGLISSSHTKTQLAPVLFNIGSILIG